MRILSFIFLLFCSFFVSVSAEIKNDINVTEKVENKVEEQKKNELIEKVNINFATKDELVKKLQGIGEKKAEKIIEYREKYGLFTEIEQLMEVSGIGKATFEKNRAILVL